MNVHKQLLAAALDQLLPPTLPLSQLAHYSLESGKRIRPLMTIALTEALQGNIKGSYVPAATLELIHTYSLIHDDLPCMDDDSVRRGKPSLHVAFPEWKALLTGDLLLTRAFEALASAPHLSDRQRLQLIRVLGEASGGKGLIGGQVLDLEMVENPRIDSLLLSHEKKTGALFEATFAFAAILSEREIPPLAIVGKKLGIAFQLADDLSDGDGVVGAIGSEETVQLLERFKKEVILELRQIGIFPSIEEEITHFLQVKTSKERSK